MKNRVDLVDIFWIHSDFHFEFTRVKRDLEI